MLDEYHFDSLLFFFSSVYIDWLRWIRFIKYFIHILSIVDM